MPSTTRADRGHELPDDASREDGARHGPVPPIRLERRRRSRGRGLFLLAPLVAAAIALGVLGRGPARDVSAVRVARALAPARPGAASAATLYGERWDEPPWSAVRDEATALGAEAMAFRLGARSAEFELAHAAGDTAAIARATQALARLAAALPGGGATAARVRAVAGRVGANAAVDRTGVIAELRTLAGGADWFDAGAWCDAARIAAAGGRADFFAADAPAMVELRRLVSALDAHGARTDDVTRAAVERLRALAASTAPTRADLGVVGAAIDSTMRDAGR